MNQNPFTFLGQAVSQLLTTKSATFQTMGLHMFRGLAVILIVWFGVQAALSAAHGHGGFNFARFADLILLIAFGLGMLTYYSTPIPGVGYSFSDLITQEALQLSGQIESDQTQQIADAVVNAETQLGSPPGIFSFHESLTFIVMAIALAAMQATAFAIIAYGYVASAVCVLLGPIFIPFFIVPKMDWLFWGWVKAFLGFSFYQVVAAAFTFLPALLVTLFVCIYGLIKIPELTASIFGGRSGSWVNPLG